MSDSILISVSSSIAHFIVGIACIGAGWMVCLPSHAQPVQESEHAEQILQPESRALQFQIGSNFTLGAFQGTFFSGKWHLSSHSALRAGVGLDASFQDRETSQQVRQPDELQRASEGNQTTLDLRLDAQYLRYLTPRHDVSLYVGGGPSLGFRRQGEEGTEEHGSGEPQSETERTSMAWSTGLAGVVGVEWFVSQQIGLTAEYGVRAAYRRSTNELERTQFLRDGEQGSTTVRETEISTFEMRGGPVRFGVSVYF